MPNEIDTVKAVEKANKQDDTQNLITLSTGVVLRGKMVNPVLLMKVMTSFPRPKPPVWINPEMGREMENTDDPDYLDRLQTWKMESSSVTLNVMILHGTEFVSAPKGFPKPEDDVWLDEYALLGLQMMPMNKSWRYLEWVTSKAVGGAEDLQKIQEVVGRLSGVTEKAVEAADTFPERN